MSAPSFKAYDAADAIPKPLLNGRRALNAAHDRALGLDRSVCLRDVFEALKAKEFGDVGPGGIWYVLPHLTTYGRAADFIAQEFASPPSHGNPERMA